MKDLPTEVSSYRRSPEFTDETVPKGLLRAHRTKEGTWGKIVVLKGKLRYRVLEPEVEELDLSPSNPDWTPACDKSWQGKPPQTTETDPLNCLPSKVLTSS